MKDKREIFARLHQPGNPLLLYNAWDAGSARAVADAGAPAIATGSHSLAGAQGYPDGEAIPLATLLESVRRIVAVVDVPVSVDFEGGFAVDPARLAEHATYLSETGAIGCNFEDRKVGGEGLHGLEEQAKRVAAVASAGLFVNARTDLFLSLLVAGRDPNDRSLLSDALERAAAYGEAGAGSFFAPGLSDPELIADLCAASPLPVNIMVYAKIADWRALAQCGVARLSWGPGPWRLAMATLKEQAEALYRS
ncbi:isocitrate lyase/phosphoenolpyruvate mutase family protein [Altererythrobacter salegens]|uniref:Isocitrate lyase/phosphoenolpyruvate mutase family protein n=1 Tax=Croceibacterium salegens TaxID=1737568 RepID=A0A6I4SRJ9_9SPHN|nr:isocitrate lyase/phosphoenolpyruvate mutase family protein [Croceibacterium salegens]MXO58601.1 isocitrate lyase/phosphoenolpyruvate mutase family protein [Croceibacterium salegens]